VEEPLQTTTTTYAGSHVRHDDPLHEPTLGELFVELSDDFSHLVRQEMALARAEISENLNRGRQGATQMAIGGVLAYTGLLALIAAIVILVGNWIDSYWLSALLVGAIIVAVGVVMLLSGKGKLEKMNLVPKKTINSIERDAKTVKEKLT
jgi:predicted phage tail protein